MKEIAEPHHLLRHLRKTAWDGDYLDSSVFRLKQMSDGSFEDGLSTNHVEYFGEILPAVAVKPVSDALRAKGRTVKKSSWFASLNVSRVKLSAEKHCRIKAVESPELPLDPSHSLIIGYESFNDLVSEEIKRSLLPNDIFPAE